MLVFFNTFVRYFILKIMILNLKYCVFVIGILLFSSEIVSQDSYKIKINIEGNSDSLLLLTSYYGEKIKLVDTAYNNSKGDFIFEGYQKLPGGIYMTVSSDKKKLFEFIVGKDQNFSMQTDTSNYVQNMKIVGSKDNQVFFDYLLYNENLYQKNKELVNKIDSLSALNLDVKDLQNERNDLNKEAINYKIDIINNNKDLFVSTLLNSMRDVDIPDSLENSIDSTSVYRYYRTHYWDNLKLNDSSLLRTPILMRKVKQYMDNMVAINPDSVITAIDDVIAKTRPSKEVTGYLVWHFISEYQNPKYMGFDKVFVHLVDNYFSKEEIINTTPSILSSLQERADKIRPILLNMPAPNLILIDTAGVLTSFRSIKNKYTVLFFWDSECGICGKEIIAINDIYKKPEYDFEVFAINVNSDLEKWKEAIKEKNVPGINVNGTRSATKDFHDLYDIYGTPVIYVLDKEKRIIAKRISADKLAAFFDNYEKFSSK